MDNNPIIKKQKIEFAIVQERLLLIDYVAKDLKVTKDRTIIPQKMTENEVREIDKVYATDIKDMKLRSFDFTGIQNIRILEKGEGLKGGEKT